MADTYDVPLDQNAPLQDARIEIGFYDPVSGVRLPVVDENGNVIADHVIYELEDTGAQCGCGNGSKEPRIGRIQRIGIQDRDMLTEPAVNNQ